MNLVQGFEIEASLLVIRDRRRATRLLSKSGNPHGAVAGQIVF